VNCFITIGFLTQRSSSSCFHGFGSLTCCQSELIRNNESYRQVVRILGRGSALLKAATYREMPLHACPEWESNLPSHCSSGRGHFVPHSAWLLWSGEWTFTVKKSISFGGGGAVHTRQCKKAAMVKCKWKINRPVLQLRKMLIFSYIA
jgi:hypothetical protein